MKSVDWGLKQGLLGAAQNTLSPSLTSLGPNRYLTRNDFLKMLGVAVLLHALVLGIASLVRDDSVKDIPVRALSFKIGDADGAVSAPRMMVSAPIAPPKPVAPPVQAVPHTPSPRIAPPVINTPPTDRFAIPLPRQIPVQNPTPLELLPSRPAVAPLQPTSPVASTPPLAALPDPALLSQPAVAMNPQRFIREAGSAEPGADRVAENAQAARARYELEVSGWIQKHKLYPANAAGAEGRAVVRMRIDRMGNVRYYAIEESSNNTVLDAAAIDMIRRANPMPVVPVDYPAGSLVEFLIPISFKVPR
jgi:protein TonB